MRAYRRVRVRLKKGDREKLDEVLSGGVQPVRTVLRALALSHLHAGKSTSEVAAMVRLTAKSVRQIGRRYESSGLVPALYDKPRPGAAPVLDDSQRQRIIAMVCSDPPEGRARWEELGSGGCRRGFLEASQKSTGLKIPLTMKPRALECRIEASGFMDLTH